MPTSLKRPKTAWPTIALAVLALSTFAASFVLLATGTIGTLVASTLATMASFAAFTPMHDASHQSVSRNDIVNNTIGRLCGFTLGAPLAAFRYVHLEHHKHTNDPARDPDYYAGRGRAWQLPLRWLTQDLHYYIRILRAWRRRPRSERIEIVIHFTSTGGAIALLVAAGFGYEVIFAWLVPARVAIGVLSFAFDYLPHAPHQALASENRYAATRVIEAPGLTPLLLYQNYHLIHHLYPGVPFYRYRAIFEERRSTLEAKGARITRFGAGKSSGA